MIFKLGKLKKGITSEDRDGMVRSVKAASKKVIDKSKDYLKSVDKEAVELDRKADEKLKRK